jgi:mRNA-degrading endonuclease RelE of RelBE toxin-antitoxin system
MDEFVIKATPKFLREAHKLLSEDDLEQLYDLLSINPNIGSVISGTGGVRKLRWSPKRSNKGKSGGVRILYHYSNHVLIILLGVFSKSESENISQAEKNELKNLLPSLIKIFKEDL